MGRVGAVLLALLLVGCTAGGAGDEGASPDETGSSAAAVSAAEQAAIDRACRRLADQVADALQGYVDQFTPADADADGAGSADGLVPVAPPARSDLDEATAAYAEQRERLGCDPGRFRGQLRTALDGLAGGGPLARAVVPQVRDEVVGVTGPPRAVTVEVGDDLVTAVHGADPGAVVTLAPGRHELAEPLVLLRSLTLAGAGADTTTVVSRAAGAVVLQLGTGQLRVTGVTFRHEGTEPASVLVLATGGHDLRDVGAEGGVASGDGDGWGIVLGGADEDDVEGATGRLERARTLALRDNEAGGLVVTDGRAPTLVDVVATGNDLCGVCWLGDAAGALDGARLDGNDIGLSLAGAAAPSLADVEVTGNASVGVLVDDTATATVDDLLAVGNGQAGVGVRGSSSLVLTGAVLRDHDAAAVLVEQQASVRVGGGTTVDGGPLGLLVRDEAVAEVAGLTTTGVTDAAVVFTGSATGTIGDVTCEDGVPGIVLLEAAEVDVRDDERCPVVDQRDDP